MQQRLEVSLDENLEKSSEEGLQQQVEQSSEEKKEPVSQSTEATDSQSTEATEEKNSTPEQTEQQNAQARNANGFFTRKYFPCPHGGRNHLHYIALSGNDESMSFSMGTVPTIPLDSEMGLLLSLAAMLQVLNVNSEDDLEAANQATHSDKEESDKEESDNEEERRNSFSM